MVEVRFKPVSGREDQAGGVVWRWKDGDGCIIRLMAIFDPSGSYRIEAGVSR